ncbi:MAG: integration host factor subunit beta [Deltaproteobacteria bacterium]|nr:integration host factor subunit beta [Deltaproteobacteria bacterium]
MNRSDLVLRVMEKTHLPKKQIEGIVNLIFDGMVASLSKGDRIEIRGLGSFVVRDYKSYRGRNPRTGQSVEVKPKRLPFFKVGKELKDRVNAVG